MAGVEVVLLRVGSSVASAVVRRWLTDRKLRNERAHPLSELVNRRLTDGFGRRRLAREVEAMADAVASRLLSIGSMARTDLPDNERQAALNAVVDVFDAAVDTDEVLFAADLDAATLSTLIRQRASDQIVAAGLSDAGQRLFDVVLYECCVAFVQAVLSLGPVVPRASAEVLSRLSGQGELLGQILARLPVHSLDAPSGTQDDDEFLHRYLTFISTHFDDLELFGVDTRRFRPRVSLSVAYVSLTVAVDGLHPRLTAGTSRTWADRYADDDGSDAADEVATSLRVERALGGADRTLMRGEAGSGKTTVLRWLAVTAARQGFTGDLAAWNGAVPFVVRLRSFTGRDLPRPEELLDDAAAPLARMAPQGWAHRQFSAGRALLLVDGIDELPSSRRRAGREWLRQILVTFPDIRVVVTSRPAAASARWLAAEGFAPAMLERMRPQDVRELVGYWHRAIRDAPDLPCEVEELPRYHNALLARFDGNPHLRSMATSPLLCAMLCALNLDRRSYLPRDRMSLYAAVVMLLLERRDTERQVAVADIALDGRQKIQILQYLAWKLSINNRTETSRSGAVARIGDRLNSMPHVDLTVDSVYEYLLQRSGIIREPADGRVDFVHRTFQEYLTAREAAEQGDEGFLVDKAHLDTWYQTVVMAAGHANTAVRASLLIGMLDRAEAETTHRRTLVRLATACLETVPVLDPPELLLRVQAAADTLTPPRGSAEARALAAIGEPILRRLPTDLAHLPVGPATATIQAAAHVNGPDALRLLAGYANDRRLPVQRSLISSWTYFEPHEYARTVLADAPLDKGAAKIFNPTLLPAVRHLNNLTDLGVYLFEPAVFDDLRDVPALQRLFLDGGAVGDFADLRSHPQLWNLEINNERLQTDPTGIARLTQLKWLFFQEHPHITRLDFLSGLTNLHLLVLGSVAGVRDLGPIAAMPNLSDLALDGLTIPDLTAIPRSDQLARLCLPNCVEPTNGLNDLCAMATNLVALEINFNAWINDLAPLASLTYLNYLCLRGNPITDLRPLGHLPLREIDLIDCPPMDLTPLATLPNLRRIWIREPHPDMRIEQMGPYRVARTWQESADRRRMSRGGSKMANESRRAIIYEINRRRR